MMIGAMDRSCDDDRSCGLLIGAIGAVDRNCDDDRSCGLLIGAVDGAVMTIGVVDRCVGL